jgi:RNA polymerase sigma factor (TIGR02999 family)
MPDDHQNDDNLTELLRRARRGDSEAENQAAEIVHAELRRIGRMLGKNPNDTLRPTALAHDAFQRLIDRSRADWQDRRHFYLGARKAMNRMIVDERRHKASLKEGGSWGVVEYLDEVNYSNSDKQAPVTVALLDALAEMGKSPDSRDGYFAKILDMHYFEGLTIEEMATKLGVSVATIGRDHRSAKDRIRELMASN